MVTFSQSSVVTRRDTGNSFSIALSYKSGKFSTFDSFKMFMVMGAIHSLGEILATEGHT